MVRFLENWRAYYESRTKYACWKRAPFFKLAAEYLPPELSELVVDLGPGDGEFARLVKSRGYESLALLDGNATTVDFAETRI